MHGVPPGHRSQRRKTQPNGTELPRLRVGRRATRAASYMCCWSPKISLKLKYIFLSINRAGETQVGFSIYCTFSTKADVTRHRPPSEHRCGPCVTRHRGSHPPVTGRNIHPNFRRAYGAAYIASQTGCVTGHEPWIRSSSPVDLCHGHKAIRFGRKSTVYNMTRLILVLTSVRHSEGYGYFHGYLNLYSCSCPCH